MKRNVLNKIFAIIICIIGLAPFASCNHKDLCYVHEHKVKIYVAYDWRDAPDATAGGMCVFFYSLENPGEYYRFDFANTEGGEIEIPAGKYELITYNNDTEIVRFTSQNIFEGHTATTRIGDILEPMYGNGVTSSATTDNGEKVMVTPDGLWGCHATDVVVSEHGVTYTFTSFYTGETHASGDHTKAGNTSTTDAQIITLYPHDMLCHYSYEVRNVKNADLIARVSSTLSGMSGSLNLSDESVDSEPVTLPLPGSTDISTNRIVGSFLTFGHYPDEKRLHKMEFYLVMQDGKKYVVKDAPNLDVTLQVDTASNQRRVHIIIDGLKLPDSTEENSDFTPSVDDWGVINEEIKI